MGKKLFSTAVMARRLEPSDSLDYFPTPPWATRGFCQFVLPRVEYMPWSRMIAFDPCCGAGHMAGVLAENFSQVEASDIFPHGFGRVADFLDDDIPTPPADWVFINPPFARAFEFIQRARVLARRGVAVLI